MMDPGSGLSLNLKKDSCCWHIFNLHSINKPPLVLHCTAIAFGHIIGVGHDRHKGSCSDLPYPIATQALCVLTATPCLQGQALLFHSSQQCKSFSIECLLVLKMTVYKLSSVSFLKHSFWHVFVDVFDSLSYFHMLLYNMSVLFYHSCDLLSFGLYSW